MTTTSGRRSTASGASDRGALWRWALGTGLVTGSVLVVVLVAGGGAPAPAPAGLPDAGPVTGWGLPVTRLVADVAGMVTVGLLLGAALLLPSPADRLAEGSARAVVLASRSALVWLVAVVVEVVLTTSDFLGIPPSEALDPALLRSFLGQTEQGRALLVQVAATVVVAGLARSALTARGAALALLFALGATVPPLLTGHSAAAGSHELAVASLLVHVLAATLWVGGLAALAWAAVSGGGAGLRLAVPRFSTLALWCFIAVAVSGMVNAAVRLGRPSALFTSAYGALVLGKVLALVALAAFGWWHRRHTVTALATEPERGSGRGTARAFVAVAAAELAVMAATVALAVGLSRTPYPGTDETFTSVAESLLGFPLPPAPSPSRLLLSWVPDGFALTFLVLAGLAYAAGVRVLRRRGDAWPWGRVVSWYAALGVFAFATLGGLGLYSHVLFSAHMVAHMLLSMVVPIGLVLAAPVTLALRTLPGPRTPGELGPRQLLLAVLQSRFVRIITHPLVALALFVGGLYGLYFTALFPTLMRSHLGHVLMELHFLAVGCLFFWVLVGVDPTPHKVPPIARIALLFAAMPFHAFFSIAVMSSNTVLAGEYYRALDRPYATDLLADQNLGGGIGWALGELPILLVLAAVFVQWVRADQREADRFDRAADRAAGRAAGSAAGTAAGRAAGRDRGGAEAAERDELAEYNAYLAALAARDAQAGEGPEGRQPR